MRKALVIALTALIGIAAAQLYNDVPENHWARNAVEEATRLGLITGFPDGSFRGDALLSRYQAAMILYRLVQYLEARPAAAVDPGALAAMGALLDRLQAELVATQKRLDKLDGEALRTRDIAEIQRVFEQVRALAAAAEGLAPGDLKRLTDALPELKEVLANYVALRNDVEDLRARYLGVTARLDELAIRVDEAARAAQEVQSALGRLAAANRDLAERVRALEQDLWPRLDDRYVNTKRFEGAIDVLEGRLKTAENRLDRTEERLNHIERTFPADAPRLQGLRLRIGAQTSSGPATPADLDRPGGYDGDQDVTTPDYDGPSASAHFGLSATYSLDDGTTLDYGFLAEVDPSASSGFSPIRGSAHLTYTLDTTELNVGLAPNYRFELTPYLLDRELEGFDYGARFQLRRSSFGIQAGYFLAGPGRYSFAALAYKPDDNLAIRAGFALDPASTAVLFLDAHALYSGVGLDGLCHYPTGLTNALVCYGQLSLTTDFAEVSADYRWLGANATPGAYLSQDDGDEPYRTDQAGFGVRARITLWRFLLEATWQSYNLAGTPHRYLHTAGALPLTDSLTVSVFYDAATVNYAAIPTVPAEAPGAVYRNLWGASVSYAGPADHPTLSALRATLGYEIDRALPEAYPYATLSYDLPTPRFQLALAARVRGGVNWDGKLAGAVATPPLEVFGGPSLEARAAYSNGAVLGQEILFGLGLRLARLPVPGLEVAARTGLYTATAAGAGAGFAEYDRVLDPTLPGLYGGQPPLTGRLLYYGMEASFEGFRFTAGRYAGFDTDVYTLRFDYDRRF